MAIDNKSATDFSILREKGIRESYQEAARRSSLSKTIAEGPGSDIEKYDTPEQRQQAKYSGTTTGSPTVSDDGSDKVLIFNSSGSYTG